MEYGSIRREIHIEAAPEVVFDVVSSPAHIREWWSDEANFEPAAGSVGKLVWNGDGNTSKMSAEITVVAADPPRMFSFRWVYPEGAEAAADNSLLVTFEVVPSGSGSVLRMVETGFRECGWEVAVLEEAYREHEQGWNYHLGRLETYFEQLVAAR